MRRAMAVVAGLVALALAASIGFASGAPQRPRLRDVLRSAPSSVEKDATARDRRIVVVVRNERETDIDNPPAGESVGDGFVVTGTLHRPGVRRPIGRVDVHGTVTLATRREFRILFTIVSNLPHGEIEATGIARSTRQAEDFELGVTGGTDAFDDVGGELNIVFRRAVRLVYDLRDLD